MGDTAVDRAVLLRPFDPSTYRYNEKGLVYISGPAVEQRLDRVAPGEWYIDQLALVETSGGIASSLWLVLPGMRPMPGYGFGRIGAGSDEGDGRQSAVTSAIRRAANRFGIGRELWPEVAGEHWLNWLGLLTTPEQVAEAANLLGITRRWLSSSHASKPHQDAWGWCMERVEAALAKLGNGHAIDTGEGDKPMPSLSDGESEPEAPPSQATAQSDYDLLVAALDGWMAEDSTLSDDALAQLTDTCKATRERWKGHGWTKAMTDGCLERVAKLKDELGRRQSLDGALAKGD